jgi:hypothetical protein
VPARYFHNGALQFLGERRSLLRRNESQFGIDRKRRQPLPCRGGQLRRTRQLQLNFRRQTQQVFRGKRVRNLRRISGEFAEQFWRQHVPARRSHIALLEKMTAAPAARARQKASPRQLANVVVHGLPRQIHPPSNARGRIRLGESRQNLQPKRVMQQSSGMGRIAYQVHA